MNAKKSKTLRKMLRSNGVDPSQGEYKEGRPGVRFMNAGIDSRGEPVKSPFNITGTVKLEQKSGRGAYKLAKRMASPK